MSDKYWLQMNDGRKFDLEALKPENFSAPQFINTLSAIPRFNRQTSQFYSVLRHCVTGYLVAERVYPNDRDLHQAVLTHEAIEIAFGDITSPVKRYLLQFMAFDAFEEVESRCNRLCAELYGFNYEATRERTRAIDIALCVAEAQILFPHPPIDNWTENLGAEPYLVSHALPLTRDMASRPHTEIELAFYSMLGRKVDAPVTDRGPTIQ